MHAFSRFAMTYNTIPRISNLVSATIFQDLFERRVALLSIPCPNDRKNIMSSSHEPFHIHDYQTSQVVFSARASLAASFGSFACS